MLSRLKGSLKDGTSSWEVFLTSVCLDFKHEAKMNVTGFLLTLLWTCLYYLTHVLPTVR